VASSLSCIICLSLF